MALDSKNTHGRNLTYQTDDTSPKTVTGVSIIGHSGALDELPRGSDFDLDVARGAISGMSCVQKFGHNTSVQTSGTGEDIWSVGGDYTGFLQAAVAVRIASGGNAADDQDGGAGARSVTISGLDENWAEATETVNTEGADASSATTTTFIRVNRAFVASTGAYGVGNTGAITIETTGGVTVAGIEALEGQTQMAITAVPAGKTAYLTYVRLLVGGGATKTATVSLYRRQSADAIVAPFGPRRLVQSYDTIPGGAAFETEYRCYPVFPAKTDIWFRGISQTTAQAVNCTFDLFFVDD